MINFMICKDGQEKRYICDAFRCQTNNPTSKTVDTLILYSQYNLKSGKYDKRDIFEISSLDYFYSIP